AHRVELLGDLRRRASLRALEEQVLQVVRDAGLLAVFVARPVLHPDAEGHRRDAGHGLGDDPDTVIETRACDLGTGSGHATPYCSWRDCERPADSACIASLRLRRILPCLSTSSTFTMISSPSFNTSATRLTRPGPICEICNSPSVFGRISTKAPKSTIFLTIPL